MEKFKKVTSYTFYAGLGLFSFILLCFPYMFAKIDLGTWGSNSSSISGYDLMDVWSSFSGVMLSLIAIFALLVCLALMFLGVYGILKAFKIASFPENIDKKLNVKKTGDLLLYVYAALNIATLVFTIIFAIENGGDGLSYGPSAGIFITLVFSIGAIVALKVLRKKYPETEADSAPAVSYVCSKCGASAKASASFCSKCGGAVVAKQSETKAEDAKAEDAEAKTDNADAEAKAE